MNKYDNGFSDFVTAIFGTVVRTLERVIVVFWDGLRNATVHGTPSLVGFVAAIAPVLAPIPLATMTAISLQEYLNWLPYQAILMAIVIECAGFPLWVFFTESLLRDGWRGTTAQFTLGAAVLVYESILVLINVVTAVTNGTQGTTALILFLACLFPALCAIAFGYTNTANKQEIERERREAAELAERMRQERRADRKEAQALKVRYASDTKQEKLDKPFRK
jgi:hypothetical protein